MHEEPGPLSDHRGQSGNQRHQVRTDPRLPTVQVSCCDRASVRLCRLSARTIRVLGPVALLSGAPEPQPLRLRVPAESNGTLLLARLGPQLGHLLPRGASVCAHAAARWILVTGAGTGSSLFQLYRSHASKHLQFAQCATRHVNTTVFLKCFYLLSVSDGTFFCVCCK